MPLWLDHPAAAFDSVTRPRHLIAISPEVLDGDVVMMTIKPVAQGRRPGVTVNLLTNAYDKNDGPPPLDRWVREGKTWYIDKKVFPDVLRRGGVQFSATFQAMPGMPCTLTEKQFEGVEKSEAALRSGGRRRGDHA